MALTGLVLAAAPAAARATSRPAPPAPPPKLPSGRSWTVTLVTGDVVQVRTQASGPPLVSVEPGAGRRSVPFRKDVRPDGSVRVYPLDVAAKIGKVYDPALFDVTALIKDGDDDAHRHDLPLIVQGTPAAKASKPLAVRRTLHGLGAVAVRKPKTATLAAAGLNGARHVWLDRKVHAQALDRNLSQIGAPAAWAAGATGKGVKVAVLDTGVDTGHPDLKGRIAEQRNFSQSADTVDRFGHGTHVAATIAGTGAAANGERKGVAPDADLLIGKVLGDDGTGSESDVIAGMEWAAVNAPIVGMSLGAWSPDPVNDPLTTTLDDLSAKDGTLFVVAAGNDGPYPDGIETPGAAASALTVGAVDGADHVADFSSRGGTLMKPDIAAPGVDVVAARAAGTAMGTVVDGMYTSASGTSMATPHVAGAAADLLQRHPGWSAGRLKAALVSTSDAVPGTVYQVGGGRLDVGRAATATVVGDQASAAFGSIPHGSATAVTKHLTWTNTGTSAVTVHLSASLADVHGTAVPALSLPDTMTVPAGGSAGVDVSLDPRRLTTAGLYSGAVTASAGGVSLRTPVGATYQPETHTLTFKATALPDTPDGALGGYVSVLNMDDPTLFSDGVPIGADGTATLTVPTGRYMAFGSVDDTAGDRSAFVGDAELDVTGDTTLPLDAAQAKPLTVSAPGMTPDPAAVQGLEVERGVDGTVWGSGLFAFDGSPRIYTTPIAGVRTGTFHAYAVSRLTDGGKTVDDVLHDLGTQVPASVDYQVDPHAMARLDLRFAAVEGDAKDPLGAKRYGVSPGGFLVNEADGDVPAGSTRTDYVSAEAGVGWQDEAFPPNLGQGEWVTQLPLRSFTPGSTHTEAWGGQPFRPGPYSATEPTVSVCAPAPTTRAPGNIHVELVDLQDLPDGDDCLTDAPDWDAVSSRTMTLSADGAAAGTVGSSHGDFSVPATAGTYRLHYTVDASKALPVSTRTTTDWTFRSRPGETRVPLLLVNYALPLDLFNHPDGDTATLTVARVAGAAPAKATGLQAWTSLDDGKTWRPAHVSGAGGTYSARLPHAGKGQGVSLRVRATDAGGGIVDQTIIRAYLGA